MNGDQTGAARLISYAKAIYRQRSWLGGGGRFSGSVCGRAASVPVYLKTVAAHYDAESGWRMTQSQRDRQQRLIAICMAALAVLVWLEWRLQSRSWHEFAVAVIPNMVVGLLGVLGAAIVVPWLLTDKDRLRYIAATSSIRAALRNAREAKRIEPHEVQLVMKEVVPAVSSLYFGSPKPRVRKADSSVSGVTLACGICSLDCGVEYGTCHHCGELMEVLTEMRPTPVTSNRTDSTCGHGVSNCGK